MKIKIKCIECLKESDISDNSVLPIDEDWNEIEPQEKWQCTNCWTRQTLSVVQISDIERNSKIKRMNRTNRYFFSGSQRLWVEGIHQGSDYSKRKAKMMATRKVEAFLQDFKELVHIENECRDSGYEINELSDMLNKLYGIVDLLNKRKTTMDKILRVHDHVFTKLKKENYDPVKLNHDIEQSADYRALRRDTVSLKQRLGNISFTDKPALLKFAQDLHKEIFDNSEREQGGNNPEFKILL